MPIQGILLIYFWFLSHKTISNFQLLCCLFVFFFEIGSVYASKWASNSQYYSFKFPCSGFTEVYYHYFYFVICCYFSSNFLLFNCPASTASNLFRCPQIAANHLHIIFYSQHGNYPICEYCSFCLLLKVLFFMSPCPYNYFIFTEEQRNH